MFVVSGVRDFKFGRLLAPGW